MKPLLGDFDIEKTKKWLKLMTLTSLVQVFIQIIGFISGIIIIRMLSTKEYAFYTIANSMFGMLTLLSDSGVISGVMAQGGPVYNDKIKLGRVLVTGLQLRRILSVIGLIIVVPILMFMLHNHKAGWLDATAISLALIPSFFFTLSGNIYEIPLKLNQAIIKLQKIQLQFNVLRLILIVAAIFCFPLAFFCVLIPSIPQFWINNRLKSASSAYSDFNQAPDIKIREKIFAVVKRIFPTSLYYSFSGQITIWLISIFGTTVYVAQLGALSRLNVVLTLFNLIYGILVMPQIAKMPNVRILLFRRFLLTQLLTLIILSLVVGLVATFSSPLLWVLGNKFNGLRYPLILSICAGCIASFSGYSFSFYTCRGWAIKPAVVILYDVIVTVLGVSFFNVANLEGVLKFNIYTSIMLWLLNFTYCLYKIRGSEY